MNVAIGLLVFVVLFFISVCIFVTSMVITSKILGGVDYGEARTVVLKAAGLLLVVNLIAMIPYGPLFALLAFFGGLYSLFKMEFLECVVLAVVNACLNWALRMVVVGAIGKIFGE
jgi:hypothetical protein